MHFGVPVHGISTCRQVYVGDAQKKAGQGLPDPQLGWRTVSNIPETNRAADAAIAVMQPALP